MPVIGRAIGGAEQVEHDDALIAAQHVQQVETTHGAFLNNVVAFMRSNRRRRGTLPPGYSVRGSMVPKNSRVESDLGYSPSLGEEILPWRGGAWQTYTFDAFSSTWSSAEPVLGIGETLLLHQANGGSTAIPHASTAAVSRTRLMV